MPWLSLQIPGRLGTAADLNCRDSTQQIGVEKCTRVRLDRDKIGVDLNRDLDLCYIVRINANVGYAAHRNPVILNRSPLAEPGYRSLKEDVIVREHLRKLGAAQPQHGAKRQKD